MRQPSDEKKRKSRIRVESGSSSSTGVLGLKRPSGGWEVVASPRHCNDAFMGK